MVEGDDPKLVHQKLAATMDTVIGEIHAIQRRGPGGRRSHPPGLAGHRLEDAERADS
jgi:phosphoketolase